MKKTVKTAEGDAMGRGCGYGCGSYVVLALILAWITGDWGNDGWQMWFALAIGAIIGIATYKVALPELEKQAVEKKKKAADGVKKEKKKAGDAVKKEKERIEDKLDKIKSDAGVDEGEGTEEDQKRRYQEYLDGRKKKK
ncbi:MAG: hypothetical protein ACKVG7_05940 [Flavobacteriales bacterium]